MSMSMPMSMYISQRWPDTHEWGGGGGHEYRSAPCWILGTLGWIQCYYSRYLSVYIEFHNVGPLCKMLLMLLLYDVCLLCGFNLYLITKSCIIGHYRGWNHLPGGRVLRLSQGVHYVNTIK